jgi:thiol:disulfide interchange protein DsbD
VIADREVVGPGETFRLAVVFDLAPKWHVYWKDPGAGGLPPRVRVTAPDGYRVGEPQFTRPRVFPTPIGDEFGYYDEAVVFVPVRAPESLDEGSLHIEVAVDWAVCKEVCLLGRASRDVAMETAGRRPAQRAAPPEVIRRHEKRLPRPLGDLEGATLAFDGAVLRIDGPASGTRRVTFFPERVPGVVYRDVRATVSGDRFRVTANVELNPGNALGRTPAIAGLVALGERPDDPCYDFTLTYEDGGVLPPKDLENLQERGAPQ